MPLSYQPLSRRKFVTGIAAGGVLAGLGLAPGLSSAGSTLAGPPRVLSGTQFNLDIGYQQVNFTGRQRVATTINGTLPAPVLRWREGDRVTLRVTNHLAHDSSIHWHGMILPTNMDGVPGMSFNGIKPGETFTYQFDVGQSGTYWYHSHSGYQEQTGLYGAIVIDPAEQDPVDYDRDYVVLLSDWSDEKPEQIYANLKKMSHYYNFRERTAGDLWRDIRNKGLVQTWNERAMWNRMRMTDSDIADVTGYTYTYLMNGVTPEDGWTGLFKPGEKVRLRFINGSAMTLFDVRIPGLKMTVVAADGQNVEPVSVDEFRIGTAETYDVIVQPDSDSAYTIFAQSIDRSGYTRGTLSADPSLQAEVPAMDTVPVLGHRDMGMAMPATGAHAGHGKTTMQHGQPGHHDPGHHNHGHHKRNPGHGMVQEPKPLQHASSEFGPQVDMRVEQAPNGLHDPGIGLRQHQQLHGRRVLTYADLANLFPTIDQREPGREIELHLTGNMSRYMWSMNGIKFTDAEPLQLHYGERVRIKLVNDTMMTHPIHLHGLWSELESVKDGYLPRKHTVLVHPGSSISYQVTADARGRWAYHCHLLYHMAGMFREVRVS